MKFWARFRLADKPDEIEALLLPFAHGTHSGLCTGHMIVTSYGFHTRHIIIPGSNFYTDKMSTETKRTKGEKKKGGK